MNKIIYDQNLYVKSSDSNKRTDSYPIICGYASIFNNVDKDNDIISPGAFASSNNRIIRLLWQHNTQDVIGIIDKYYEDDRGLYIEAEINTDTAKGVEAISLIKQKAVINFSIGFNIKSHYYNEQNHRVINDLSLEEISLVTFPANSDAKITFLKHSASNFNGMITKLDAMLSILRKI